MSQRYLAGFVTASYNGLLVPDAPTINTAVSSGANSALVTLNAPTNVGGGNITSFTVSSNTGISSSNASSPITVTGLTTNSYYTFTAVATNIYGSGPASAASNSVIIQAVTILPAYAAQGASSYISSPTGTINGTPYKLMGASSNMGLANTTYLDSHNYYVADTNGTNWYIAANWGYGLPSRWSGVNRMGFPGSGASSDPAYTTADGIPVNLTNLQLNYVRTGTAANTIVFTSDYTANSSSLKPGSFQFDALIFSNGAGAGFANWYADNSKLNQTYPTIVTSIFNGWNGNTSIQIYESVGQGTDDTGWLWWRPPLKTSEVMIDFANSYNNLPCRLFVWNNYTGTAVLTVTFGNFGSVNTAANAINDPYSRTIIIKHTVGYVYFMGDADPTIAGSHYYLYR